MSTTPHNEADVRKDIAKTVLMPGDPLRSKYIAENFLENPRLVNNVRGVQGYTGRYKGAQVTVMASGMGMPSIGIYAHELYEAYAVQNIIRVGSAGAISERLKLGDICIAQAACTNSNYAKQFDMPGTLAPIASFALLERAVKLARERGMSVEVGNLLSTDTFYNATRGSLVWNEMDVLAVDMEAAALYLEAMYFRRRALTICTISDELYGVGRDLSPEERERGFKDMIELALDLAKRCD